jgi:hypothetical protein
VENVEFSKLSLPYIVQLNFVRFGSSVIATLLISVLVPIYRYNMRLAAFYDGRAIALQFMASPIKLDRFARAASAVTPSFGFGKSSDASIDQITELYRLAAQSGGTDHQHSE